ncbi:MAG TPA: HAMP domain-containing protein, partial [Candidatus Acidoferrales bacterium]|nr:HAMP domain-containing protein [Candidatus Acidoferrales bacterium]
MTFPAKVFFSFLAAFALAAGLLFSAAIGGLRHTYGQMEQGQVAAAFENVRREMDRGADDVSRRVGLVAESEATLRMALDLSRPQSDYSVYANDASGAARTHALELFEFVTSDGTIISSTESSGASGHKEDWVPAAAQATGGRAFLRHWMAGGQAAIAQLAVRELSVGERKLYVVGGRLVDHRLLAALPLGPGMRALLLVDPGGKCDAQQLWDSAGAAASPGTAAEFLTQVCRNPSAGGESHRFADSVARENDYVLPLTSSGQNGQGVLGAVMIGYSSTAQYSEEQALWRRMLLALALGLAAGSAVSYGSAKRMVRPLVRLARSARDIAALSPGARAEERGGPEVVALAQALNQAAQKLAAERERSLQAERVAAWREMTRRVTTEIEAALVALGDARVSGDVSEGIASFQRVLDRFRDFGELLVLPMQSVRLNDVVRAVLRDLEPLFNPSVSDITRPPISPEVSLAEDLPAVRGDSSALGRALDTFLLYAVYSMSAGGTFVIRTERVPGFVVLRIEWPAAFPNDEEAVRMFSSVPVKRTYSTGLELAVAQAIISDHDGTVEAVRGVTASALVVRLPEEPAAPAAGVVER